MKVRSAMERTPGEGSRSYHDGVRAIGEQQHEPLHPVHGQALVEVARSEGGPLDCPHKKEKRDAIGHHFASEDSGVQLQTTVACIPVRGKERRRR